MLLWWLYWVWYSLVILAVAASFVSLQWLFGYHPPACCSLYEKYCNILPTMQTAFPRRTLSNSTFPVEASEPRQPDSAEERVKRLVDEAAGKLERVLDDGKATICAKHWLLQPSKGLPAEVGGTEGLCLLIKLVAIDADGDGRIGDAEMERYGELARQMVETANGALTNRAVVSALILSVIFALPQEVFESEWEDVFNKGSQSSRSVEYWLRLLAYLMVQVSVALSIKGVTDPTPTLTLTLTLTRIPNP